MEKLEKAEGTLPDASSEVEKVEVEETKTPLTETEDFKKALREAQSGWDKQIALQKTEAQKAKAEAEQLRKSHGKLEQEVLSAQAEVERFISEHDPDALAGYKNSKLLQARERRAAEKEDELRLVEAAQEGLGLAFALNEKANELQAKYNIPREILEQLSTVEQMEAVAKAFPEKGAEKPKPKFDSGLGSGVASRSFAKLEQDYADGLIPTAEYEEAMKGRRRR